MWQIEIRHHGLNKYRVIRGQDQNIVDQKAAAQKAVWDEMWAKKVAAERKALDKQSKNQEALERSKQALGVINELETTLKAALVRDNTVH